MKLNTLKLTPFYIGTTLSSFGAELLPLLLPLLASQYLHLSAAQISYLLAMAFIPAFTIGLVAGPMVDRLPLLLVIRICTAARAVLVLVLAGLVYMQMLTFPLLMISTFLLGALRLCGDIAYGAIVPNMVGEARLLTVNARVATSQSLAALLAPLSAGWIFSNFGATWALTAQTAAFLLATLAFYIFVFQPLHADASQVRRKFNFVQDVREGLVFVWRNPLVRWLFFVAICWNLIVEALMVVIIIHASKVLQLSPTLLGLALSTGGGAFLLGTLLTERLLKHVAPRVAVAGTMAAPAIACVPLLLTSASGSYPLVALLAAVIVLNFCAAVHKICSLTARQQATPAAYLARVQSSARLTISSVLPLGSIWGGLLMQHLSPFASFAQLLAGSTIVLLASLAYGRGVLQPPCLTPPVEICSER